MNVVFCASEVFPLAKTGGLADVCGTLPLALEKLKVKPTIFLPHYQTIDRSFKIEKTSSRVSKTKIGKDIDVFLIEHKDYFGRSGLYGDRGGDYFDNLKRFQYFSLQVFETLKELKISADILHCHDWQTALIPVYLKEKFQQDAFFKKTKTILTIHNLAFQGIFPKEEFSSLSLRDSLFGLDGLEFFGKMNLLKAGIIFSDLVTTVSPQYAKEILTREFGCGLEGVLKRHKKNVTGILNGLDGEAWNPNHDPVIKRSFSLKDVEEGKAVNKRELQERVGLPVEEDVPLFAFVGRLSHQKGIDLVTETLEDLLALDVQVVIQGVGNGSDLDELRELARAFPQKLSVIFDFDEKLAHQVYAGSDFFLMPSRFEPCGLSQMISLRYGSIPIVYKTGGLMDTVISYRDKSKGNGLLFEDYSKMSFNAAILKAMEIYEDKVLMKRLIENAFVSDFSWHHSALEYYKQYEWLLSE